MVTKLVLAALFIFISHSASAQGLNLSKWPEDIAAKIKDNFPEVKESNLTPEKLNSLIKKIDERFNFNSLQLIQDESSGEYFLAGEISPEVSKISFDGLSDLSDTDAIGLMNLNSKNLLEEESLTAGTQKLAEFYRDLGYSAAKVTYQLIQVSSLSRELKFTITKKEKTKLIRVKVDGLPDRRHNQHIQERLQNNNWRATWNKDTVSKLDLEFRKLLSAYGYYTTEVPSPQIRISADDLQARVLYKIVPNTLYNIEVTQTNAYSPNYLEDEVLKLETYSSKDNNFGSDLADRLKVFYVTQGYPHVSVTVIEQKNENHTDLILKVDEGPFTQIKTFNVIGQISRPEDYYIDKFYELSSARVKNRIYLKEDIEETIKNLLISIQNEGYINAKFSRVLVTTEKEKPGNGTVIIQLDEGQQVTLETLEVIGASPENNAKVLDILGLNLKQGIDLERLELSLAQIQTYYQSRGYIDYKLLNEEGSDLLTYTDNNVHGHIKLNIHEGPKVEVQSIVVEGNERTLENVIRIELEFKPGDILTPAKIDESISRLQRTGFFNSVEISTPDAKSDVVQRTVVVKVVERDPGILVLGGGLTDENKGTLHGYGGLAYRNFFGRGVGLSGRTELNYNFATIRYLEQKHTLGFVWPYLFESRARFRTTATRANTIADIRINKITEANTAVFSLEQDFTSSITGSLAYTVTTFKDHGITSEDEVKNGYSSESLVIGSIGPTFDFDYRNNLFNPTKGSISSISFEFGLDGIGNNNVDDYFRVLGQTTHYFPVKNTGIVFAQAVRAGYLQNIDADKNEGVPFDKRGFSLGGRTTIRGFESSEFFPTTADIGSSYKLTTGASFQLIKSELRFPLSTKYDVTGAVFYDGGQVLVQGLTLSDAWRDSAGFGVRYNTPVGPLSLEYARKLEKKASESDGAFHLSVGVF